jgi:hypothetical protein
VHAVSLVHVEAGRITVGDLFEQRIDVSAARQRDRVQQPYSC